MIQNSAIYYIYSFGVFQSHESLNIYNSLISLLSKIIRDEGPKTIKTQIMGETLRVTSKSRDDLQTVMRLVEKTELDFATQFTNFR